MEKSVFNTLPMLFFIYSPDGVYLDVLGGNETKRFENAKKLIGFHINDVFEENMANFVSEKLKEVVSSNKALSLLMQLVLIILRIKIILIYFINHTGLK